MLDDVILSSDELEEFFYISAAAGIAVYNAVTKGMKYEIDGSSSITISPLSRVEFIQINDFATALVEGNTSSELQNALNKDLGVKTTSNGSYFQIKITVLILLFIFLCI